MKLTDVSVLMLPSQSNDWKGILGAMAPILVTIQYGL